MSTVSTRHTEQLITYFVQIGLLLYRVSIPIPQLFGHGFITWQRFIIGGMVMDEPAGTDVVISAPGSQSFERRIIFTYPVNVASQHPPIVWHDLVTIPRFTGEGATVLRRMALARHFWEALITSNFVVTDTEILDTLIERISSMYGKRALPPGLGLHFEEWAGRA